MALDLFLMARMGWRTQVTIIPKIKQAHTQISPVKVILARRYYEHVLLLFSHSVVSYSLWPHGLQHTRLLSFIISQSLLKLMSIELVMPSNCLILCRPLLLLPSVFSSIRVFSNESVLCIKWPNYWSFSFSISPSNSGLISFRIDWFDLLEVQGTQNFSNTTVQKQQFFGAEPSLWSNSHIHTCLLEKS